MKVPWHSHMLLLWRTGLGPRLEAGRGVLSLRPECSRTDGDDESLFSRRKVFTKPRFSKIAVYHSLSNGYGLGYGLGAYAPGPTMPTPLGLRPWAYDANGLGYGLGAYAPGPTSDHGTSTPLTSGASCSATCFSAL